MQSSSQAKTLRMLMVENGKSIYSEYADGSVLSTFNLTVRGSFFVVKKGFELEPSLIKKWKWDSKDNSYVLTLDENLNFHDGSKPTIEDFEFSLLRGFFSEKRTFYEIYLGNVLGVDKIKPGDKYKPGLVNGITKLDAHTLKIKLSVPNPTFLYSLTRPFFSLTSQRFYNDDLMTWKKWPIGAGQFKVTAEDDQKVILSNTKKDQPIVTIEMYKRHIDGVNYDITYVPDRIKRGSRFLTDSAVSISTLFFNTENELSKDKHFRKSLYHGINRSESTNANPSKQVSYQFLPSAFWINKPTDDPFNMKLAKIEALKVPDKLRLAKWKAPFFSFGTTFTESAQKLVDTLEKQLKEIGYDISFYPDSQKFLDKATAEKSPFRLSGRICDNLDPLLMFGSFKTNSAYKYDNAQNDPIFDKLYEKVDREEDTEKRIQYLRELSKYTIDHNFMIPLFELRNEYFYNPDTIKSLGNQSEPVTLDFSRIELVPSE